MDYIPITDKDREEVLKQIGIKSTYSKNINIFVSVRHKYSYILKKYMAFHGLKNVDELA